MILCLILKIYLAAAIGASTDGCSQGPDTIVLFWLSFDNPNITILFDSVPPDVNVTYYLLTSKKSATLLLLSSSLAFASKPYLCMDEGFPNALVNPDNPYYNYKKF